MIIRKTEDGFLIKVFREYSNVNIFDIDSIRKFFRSIFNKLKKEYEIEGFIEVDIYVNEEYGMIIEMNLIDDYTDYIDMKIKVHLDSLFLVSINSQDILDYEDVYYYKGMFYGNYSKLNEGEIIYKDTEDIIMKGIKIC